MSKTKKMNVETFENELNSNGVVCVAFKATWCGPCKIMSPILDQLSEEINDAVIGIVDVEEQRELASKHNVKGIPTLVFFKDGKEIKRLSGRQDKQTIINELDALK